MSEDLREQDDAPAAVPSGTSGGSLPPVRAAGVAAAELWAALLRVVRAPGLWAALLRVVRAPDPWAALLRVVRVSDPWAALVRVVRAPGLWAAAARAVLAALGRVLAPDACAACDRPAAPGAVFCEGCAASVVRDHQAPSAPSAAAPSASGEGCAPPLEVIAFAEYGGAVARAVRRLKYEERPDLARPLGQLLQGAARGIGADVVVPVPLHPRKLRARGYNQAALLAAAVARELSAPLAARALVRARDTAAQARLDRAERLHNLDSAFRARAPEGVRGRRVVLVDDVCTTGSTLGACRDALLRAGAASVTAVVLARANDRRGGAPSGEDRG